MSADLGLSALTEDQLVSVLREVLAEAGTRKVAAQRAAQEVVLDEQHKLSVLLEEIAKARTTAKARAEAEFRASVAAQAQAQAATEAVLTDAEKSAIAAAAAAKIAARLRIEAEEKEKIAAESRAKAEAARLAMDAERAKVERYHARLEAFGNRAKAALAADPGEWSIHVWERGTDRRVYLEKNPGYRQSSKYVLFSVGDIKHKPGLVYVESDAAGKMKSSSEARAELMRAADKELPAGTKVEFTVAVPAKEAHV